MRDAPSDPRYIETVRGWGYRFIGGLDREAGVPGGDTGGCKTTSPVIGRGAELGMLEAALSTAAAGQPQLVFVTGEPGIGKTTLAETFAEGVSWQSVALARGQCIEQGSAGEAYLPVLQALGSLGRENASLVCTLRRHAPTWLAQLPALVARRDRDAGTSRPHAITVERFTTCARPVTPPGPAARSATR